MLDPLRCSSFPASRLHCVKGVGPGTCGGRGGRGGRGGKGGRGGSGASGGIGEGERHHPQDLTFDGYR